MKRLLSIVILCAVLLNSVPLAAAQSNDIKVRIISPSSLEGGEVKFLAEVDIGEEKNVSQERLNEEKLQFYWALTNLRTEKTIKMKKYNPSRYLGDDDYSVKLKIQNKDLIVVCEEEKFFSVDKNKILEEKIRGLVAIKSPLEVEMGKKVFFEADFPKNLGLSPYWKLENLETGQIIQFRGQSRSRNLAEGTYRVVLSVGSAKQGSYPLNPFIFQVKYN